MYSCATCYGPACRYDCLCFLVKSNITSVRILLSTLDGVVAGRDADADYSVDDADDVMR